MLPRNETKAYKLLCNLCTGKESEDKFKRLMREKQDGIQFNGQPLSWGEENGFLYTYVEKFKESTDQKK